MQIERAGSQLADGKLLPRQESGAAAIDFTEVMAQFDPGLAIAFTPQGRQQDPADRSINKEKAAKTGGEEELRRQAEDKEQELSKLKAARQPINDLSEATKHDQLTKLYIQLKDQAKQTEHFTRAISIWKQEPKAGSGEQRGDDYAKKNDHAKAILDYEDELKLIRKNYGESNPLTARIELKLGNAYLRVAGQADKATEHYERSLKDLKQYYINFGDGRAPTEEGLAYFGKALVGVKLTESERQTEGLLLIDPSDRAAWQKQINQHLNPLLAMERKNQQRAVEAGIIDSSRLTILDQLAGYCNHNQAAQLNEIALLIEKSRQADKDVLARRLQRIGFHYARDDSFAGLSERLPKSSRAYEEALQLGDRSSNNKANMISRNALWGLKENARRGGQFDKYIEYAQREIEMSEQLNLKTTAKESLKELGIQLTEHNQEAAAIKAFERCLAIETGKDEIGKFFTSDLESASHLGDLYEKSGDLVNVIRVRKQEQKIAEEEQKRLAPKDEQWMDELKQGQARIDALSLERDGRIKEAEQKFKDSFETASKLAKKYGLANVRCINELNALTSFYERQKKYLEAEKFLSDVIKVQESSLPDTGFGGLLDAALGRLAKNQQIQGKVQEAVATEKRIAERKEGRK